MTLSERIIAGGESPNVKCANLSVWRQKGFCFLGRSKRSRKKMGEERREGGPQILDLRMFCLV